MNFNAIVDSMKEDIIKSTQELIRIKSAEEVEAAGMPFGRGVNDAYMYAMNLARELGFETKDIDGYAGHADMGEGEEVLGILVHLDVVPEGDNWTYPPYGGEIHDGKIYGRGAIDDKGPAVACMYAMKAVMNSGVKLDKKVRIIFGLDEESGWKCMKHYLEKEKPANLAFTPDADFPAIHGEKGILIFDLIKKFDSTNDKKGVRVISVKGGNRPNMVPDYCEAHIVAEYSLSDAFSSYLSNNSVKMDIVEQAGETIIRSYGISAHGGTPEQGVNAVSQLIMFLKTLDLAEGDAKDFINSYCSKIGMEYNGQSIGCGFKDEESGKLIFNVGIIDLSENGVKVVVNIRYPITSNACEVYDGIHKELEGSGIKIEEKEHQKPIYMPKDHDLIKKLMKVYKNYTGDDREPITISGGTYARAMDNAVAFGPLFPGQEELAHQRDEFISVDNLMDITKIYANAIYELAK